MTDRPDPSAAGGEPPADPLDVLAAEYVLGTLAAEARRDVEARLPREPALRAAVDRWETQLLPLTRLAPPVEPQAALWARIEASLDGLAAARTRSAAPTPAAATGPARGGWRDWWHSLALWRGLAATGFAAALLLAVVPRVPAPAASQYVVVLVAPDNQQPAWVAQAVAGGQLRLQPVGAAPIPPDKAMELWTLVEGRSGPVSLGLVPAGQPAQVLLERLPPLRENQLFEISLEPATGSPTGKPTGPVLYIGRAVRLAS